MGHRYVLARSLTYGPPERMLTVPSAAGKDRRETGEFIGAEGVRKHLKQGPPRRRVGLTVEGAPARRESSRVFAYCCMADFTTHAEGAKIFAPSSEEQIGTSQQPFRVLRTSAHPHCAAQESSRPGFPRRPSGRTSRWRTSRTGGTRRAPRSPSTSATSCARPSSPRCRSYPRGTTADEHAVCGAL